MRLAAVPFADVPTASTASRQVEVTRHGPDPLRPTGNAGDPLYTSAFACLRTKGVAGELSANGATGMSAFNLRTVLVNVIADSRVASPISSATRGSLRSHAGLLEGMAPD